MGNTLSDNDIHERLERLIKRRMVDLSNIKFRGKLRTIKWFQYEANQKQHLMKYFEKSISEI